MLWQKVIIIIIIITQLTMVLMEGNI